MVVVFFAGKENVALEWPASALAAAPAARRKFSSAKVGLLSPSPVKTNTLVARPGILITSSVFPVAPRSERVSNNFLLSSATSPLSITSAPCPFFDDVLNERPTTRISSLMAPSERCKAVIESPLRGYTNRTYFSGRVSVSCCHEKFTTCR